MLYKGQNHTLTQAIQERQQILEDVYRELLGPSYDKVEAVSSLLKDHSFAPKQKGKTEMGFGEIPIIDHNDLSDDRSRIRVYSKPLFYSEGEIETDKDKLLFKYGLPYASFILYALQEIPVLTALYMARRFNEQGADYALRSVNAHFSIRFRNMAFSKAGLYVEEPRKLTSLMDDIDDKDLLEFCLDWNKIVSKVPTENGKEILRELPKAINVIKICEISDITKLKRRSSQN